LVGLKEIGLTILDTSKEFLNKIRLKAVSIIFVIAIPFMQQCGRVFNILFSNLHIGTFF